MRQGPHHDAQKSINTIFPLKEDKAMVSPALTPAYLSSGAWLPTSKPITGFAGFDLGLATALFDFVVGIDCIVPCALATKPDIQIARKSIKYFLILFDFKFPCEAITLPLKGKCTY